MTAGAGVAAFARRVAFAVLAPLALGCSGPDPSIEASAPVVVGCVSIEAAECDFVARQIGDRIPSGRGRPFAIQIELWGCDGPAICPRSLSARQGTATVVFVGGGEPIQLTVAGPPERPQLDVEDFRWLGPFNPESPRVVGAGPFPFELGHCGLLWKVDFDGSFWLPAGQVDGDASAAIGNDRGEIVLLAPNVAEYRGDGGFVARLARFPGPKHLWGCR